MAMYPTGALNIFFSYAPEDEDALNALEKHLSLLKRSGQIEDWHRQKIQAGQEILAESRARLAQAHIILLLISADFLASDYCYGREVEQAIARHQRGEVVIIPIIVRPVDWIDAPFHHLLALPRNGKPVSLWRDRDSAWAGIVGELRQIIEQLRAGAPTAVHLEGSGGQASALPAIWNIPYRHNPFFTGRDDILTHLHTIFITGEATSFTQPYALSGLGGIGKTQIAIEYAYRYRDHYNAVLWLDASSRDTLLAGILKLANALRLIEVDEADQQLLMQAIQQWLVTHRKWLLLIDNVNASELEAISEELLPSRWYGHVLLTTRIQTTEPLAQNMSLEALATEEACHLLLKRAYLIPKDATLQEGASSPFYRDARAIVELLDGLPLALDQAGAYIYEKGSSLEGYLQLFVTQRQELLRHQSSLHTDYPVAFSAAWQLSFRAVERAYPAAIELLRLCTFLAPEQIQDAFLLECSAIMGLSLASPSNDILAINDAIGELLKYSLIKRQRGNASFSVHRLVQTALQDEMESAAQKEWAEQVVYALARLFPRGDFASWEECEALLPHGMACSAHISRWHIVIPEAATLLHHVGEYLLERARYSEAQRLVQRALNMRIQILGNDHPETASCLHTLGELALAQGNEGAARRLWQQALTIRVRALGEEHAETAFTLFRLAYLSHSQGDDKQAEEALLRVWTIYKREQVDPSRQANCLEMLYVVNFRLGKYQQGNQYSRQALEIRAQAFGADHPEIAKALLKQAYDHLSQEKYEQALLLFQQAVTLRERTLEQEHPKTALCLESLAFCYLKLRDFSQAEQYYQQALEIRQRAQGTAHPDVANCLRDFAYLYEQQGKHVQAEHYYRQALVLYEQSLGSEHIKTLEVLRDLGSCLRNQSDYEQAETLFQRALALTEETWGSEHAQTTKSLTCLAYLYKDQGKVEQADQLFQRALTITDRFTVDSFSTLQALYGAAALSFWRGAFEQVSTSIQRMHTAKEKMAAGQILNDKSLFEEIENWFSTILKCISLVREDKYEEATQLITPLMERCDDMLARFPPSDIGVKSGLLQICALFHGLHEDFESAETLLQEALTINEERYGSEHVATIDCLKLLLWTLCEQRKESQCQRALVIQQRLEDLGSLDVLTCSEVAEALEDLGHYEEALAVYDRTLQLATLSPALPSWVLDLDGKNGTAWIYCRKSLVLNYLNRSEEALEASEEALRLHPMDIHAYRQKGVALSNLERYAEVLAVDEKIIELDPRDIYAYMQRGDMLRFLGRYEEAEAAYEKSLINLDREIRLNPANADSYKWKGYVLNVLGRYEEALPILEQALALLPRDIIIHQQKAEAFCELARFEEALQSIDNAFALNSSAYWMHAPRGLVLNRLERYEEALEAFRRFLQFNPGTPDLYAQQGYALNNLSRYEEALAALELAIELDPTDAFAFRQLGFVLLKLERSEEANLAFQRAADLDPTVFPQH